MLHFWENLISSFFQLSFSSRHTYKCLFDSADLKAFQTQHFCDWIHDCSIYNSPPRPANTLPSSKYSSFPLPTHLGVYLNTSFSLCLGHHVLLGLPPEYLKSIYLHGHSPGLTYCTVISCHLPSPSHHLLQPKMLQQSLAPFIPFLTLQPKEVFKMYHVSTMIPFSTETIQELSLLLGIKSNILNKEMHELLLAKLSTFISI